MIQSTQDTCYESYKKREWVMSDLLWTSWYFIGENRQIPQEMTLLIRRTLKLQEIGFQFQYLLQTPCDAAITALLCWVYRSIYKLWLKLEPHHATHNTNALEKSLFLQDFPVQSSHKKDKKKIGLHKAAQHQYWILEQQSPCAQLKAILLDPSKTKIWPRFAQTKRSHLFLCYCSEILQGNQEK